MPASLVKSIVSLIKNPEPFYREGAKVLVRLLYRYDARGFEKIPETGPAIIISNHVAYVDGLIINAALKRPVRFVIDEAIYNVPAVKYFMQYNRAIPISANRDSVKRALEEISEGLKNGDLICIFPEGQLTYTGNLSRFKFGIEWMVRDNPVTIYPVAIRGLWGSIFSRKYRRSKWRWFPRSFRRKVICVCGEPVAPDLVHINRLQRIIMNLKNNAH